jgi:hypothetical protein
MNRILFVESFCHHFPAAIEGDKLPLTLLEEAYQEHNTEDLQCVLTVGAYIRLCPKSH